MKAIDPDTGDPKITLEEVCDHNEILIVDAENERRAHEESMRKARR